MLHQSLNPVLEFTEGSEVSEMTLKELIDANRVSDAVTVFRLCQDKGIGIATSYKLIIYFVLFCMHHKSDFTFILKVSLMIFSRN